MCSCEVASLLERVICSLAQLVTVGGVFVAFAKWRQSRRQGRSELLRNLLDDFFGNEVIKRVIAEDSTLESWEDLGIEADHRRQTIEKTISLITQICYFRANNLIEDEEFILFQDTIDRVVSTPCIFSFLCDEYRRVGEKSAKGRYHYLFAYLEKTGRSMVLSSDESFRPHQDADEHGRECSIAVDEFTEPTMIIKINRAYKERMTEPAILDATRQWWRIDPETANKVKLILAVVNGKVIRTYRRNGPWEKDVDGEHGGRYRFEGELADDPAALKFKNRSVADLFPKGASNPIRYFFPNIQAEKPQGDR